NPTPRNYWNQTHSIDMVRELIGDRMFPLTLTGLDQGMRCLSS
ncbi:MAG TPA: VWA domain-containing protein, partial [Gammaproteobacteria bacterium]|nr:VWA domain-containing protein [Gammaproteobacteria bacterium]